MLNFEKQRRRVLCIQDLSNFQVIFKTLTAFEKHCLVLKSIFGDLYLISNRYCILKLDLLSRRRCHLTERGNSHA